MSATATKTAEVLDRFGSLTMVDVAGTSVIVEDHGDHYECRGSNNERYIIGTRGGKVVSCGCKGSKYRGQCKHRAAVTEVLRRW